MDYQNWKPTVLSKKKKTTKKDLGKAVYNDNTVQTVKKTTHKGGLTGKQMYNIIESESLEVPKISVSFKKAMAQARLAQGLKQKELALRCGVKETIISGYESGKLVPENHVIQKIEKVLKTKLPRMKKPKKMSMH